MTLFVCSTWLQDISGTVSGPPDWNCPDRVDGVKEAVGLGGAGADDRAAGGLKREVEQTGLVSVENHQFVLINNCNL